jgi:hypothetical protein
MERLGLGGECLSRLCMGVHLLHAPCASRDGMYATLVCVRQVMSSTGCPGTQAIFTVSWQPPAYLGGVGVPAASLLYTVFAAANDTVPLATSHGLQAVFCGGAVGVAVSFVVSAYDTAWQVLGPPSQPSAVVVPLPNVPAAPSVTTVVPDSAVVGCFSVSWALAEDAAYPAVNVTVLVFNCSATGTNLTQPVTSNTSASAGAAAGLVEVCGGGDGHELGANVRYCFAAFATNANGAGPWSNPLAVGAQATQVGRVAVLGTATPITYRGLCTYPCPRVSACACVCLSRVATGHTASR